MIALDWLSQIKAHVRGQQAQLEENQNYFDGLREVLNSGSCSEAAVAQHLQLGGDQTQMNIQQHRTPPFNFSENAGDQSIRGAYFDQIPEVGSAALQDCLSTSDAK